jgi:hypothetical protein
MDPNHSTVKASQSMPVPANAKACTQAHARYIRWMSLRSTKLSLCIRRCGDLENIPKTIERLKSLEKLEKIEADARKRHPFQAFGTQRDVASIEAAYDWGVNIAELRELIPIGQRRLEIEKKEKSAFQ